MPRYAEIVLNLPIDQAFSYEVPDKLDGRIAVGSRVLVPFQNKDRQGYCVAFSDRPGIKFVRMMKDVLDEEPTADDRLLELTRWLSRRYISSWGEAIFAAIPPGARKKDPGRKIPILRAGTPPEKPLRSDHQRRVLEILDAEGRPVLQSDLLDRVPRSAVDALVKKGHVERDHIRPQIDVLAGVIQEPPKDITLTQEQEAALGMIAEGGGVVLLHGVTGSGKTEVYLRAIEKARTEGRQSIVLVPEIALTPQTVARFKARFSRTAVLHSMLTEAERGAQWRLSREGKVDVIIGARSAVFAPVKKLGVVVIDEEHEPAYKQENAPRYHVREVAVHRAATEGGTVVLGSATPSLESLHRARQGEFRQARLSHRIEHRKMPPIQDVDMTNGTREMKRPVLVSRMLRRAVEEAMAKGEQALLFLNRRGFTTYITCRRCGWVLRCRRCDIALTFHKKEARAVCHYCSRSAEKPEVCPECQAGRPRDLGAGTEKVEEEIRTLFPGLSVSRMDRDAMKTRANYRDALGGLWRGETDLVVGTQMIAKGFDVPNVTVVGVVSADTAFHLPDFRAAERTFQLITQVAGRAGRGPKGGRVIVQSYNPLHYSITCAAAYDLEGFVARELKEREELGYPPFTTFVRVLFQGTDEQRIRKTSERFVERFRAKVEELFAQLLGPAPAPLYRLKSRYRMHCLIKTNDLDPVLDALRAIVPGLSRSRAVQVTADVDPVNLL
ncbi:MAG: replication restart helicase PriA [Planctomycetota bacterium]